MLPGMLILSKTLKRKKHSTIKSVENAAHATGLREIRFRVKGSDKLCSKLFKNSFPPPSYADVTIRSGVQGTDPLFPWSQVFSQWILLPDHIKEKK